MEAGFVPTHFDCSALALGDVDDGDAAFGGFLEPTDEPFFLRSIARPEGLEDNSLEARDAKHGVDDALLNAGKEGEHDDVGVEEVVRLHGAHGLGSPDEVLVVADVYAGLSQSGVVERPEGVEVFSIDFGGAVAAHQFVFEEDAYFGHDRGAVGMLGGGNLDGGDEILLAVGAQGTDGELRSGKDDGLRQVFEHEAEGGGGVGHGVRAMQDDETIEVVVIVIDDFDEFGPEGGFHVRRIDGRVELIRRDAVVEAFQLGDMLKQVVEVEILKRTGFRIFYHANGSACINQKYGRVVNLHSHIEYSILGGKDRKRF